MFVYKFVPLHLKLEFANIFIYKFIPLHGRQMLMGFFYIPLISYFPTFSMTNFRDITTYILKTKSLCTILQHALALL